jgi:hypothetical protein
MSLQDRRRPPPENEKRRPGQEAADLENGTWNALQYRPASAGRQAALGREYQVALRMTRFADLAPLVTAGIDWRAIAEAVPAHALIQVAQNTGFEFDADGKSAFVLPVRTDNPLTPESADPASAIRDGAIVDLVAFHPRHPDRWALRRDAAEWLGAIEPQYLDPAPATIFRSPLSWLRADCRGLVLLGDRASQYRILTLLHSIIAEDEQHATELRRVLMRPWPAPQVIAPRAEVRYAA